MNRPIKIFIIVTATLLGGVILGDLWNTYSPAANKTRLLFALNLQNLPPSTTAIKCPLNSHVTDVVIECIFEINPSEFQNLFIGWKNFKETSLHSFKVLPLPHDFKNGGEIRLTSDQTNSKIEVIYYKE